jgi:hypothetical protein
MQTQHKEGLKKYQFDLSKEEAYQIIDQFNIGRGYNTSDEEVYGWINISKQWNHAIIGVQVGNRGHHTDITKEEALNFLKNRMD